MKKNKTAYLITAFCIKTILCFSLIGFSLCISAADENLGFIDYQNKNYEIAFPKLLEMAKSGNPSAEGLVGRMYVFGLGVDKDFKEAYEWSLKGAAAGDPLAQNVLGGMLKNGMGVPKDINSAIGWFLKSAEQNYALAQLNLGDIYSFGSEIDPQYSEAAKWYEAAAKNGNAYSQYRLGRFFLYGIGVPQNTQRGIEETTNSADLGYTVAMNELGDLHLNGEFFEPNQLIAYKWYEKSAGLNDSVGQVKSAEILMSEASELYDPKKALELIQRSAAQGNYVAMIYLVDPPASLKIAQYEDLYGGTKNLKSLAIIYKAIDQSSIELNGFDESPLGKDISNITLEPIYNVIDGEFIPNKATYEKTVEILRKIDAEIDSQTTQPNSQQKIDLLNSKKLKIYKNYFYKDIALNRSKIPLDKDVSYQKRIQELKIFGNYLLSKYPKENLLHSYGYDFLVDYYIYSPEKGKLTRLNELMAIEKSDAYLAPFLIKENLNDKDVCEANLSNVLDNASYLNFIFDTKDEAAQAKNLSYILSGVGKSRSCFINLQEAKKNFYGKVRTFALWARQIDAERLSERRLIELNNDDIDQQIIHKYELATAFARGGNYKKAEREMLAVVDQITQSKENIKSGRVNAWANNPKGILTSIYIGSGFPELAAEPIKRSIRVELAGLPRYGESIINTSLATSFFDYAYILEKNGDYDQAIYLLKKAFQFQNQWDLELSKINKSDEMLNRYRGLNETLYRKLISLLIKTNRTLEAELVLRFLKQNEMADYLRDEKISKEIAIPSAFYSKSELLMDREYASRFEKIKKSYKDGYKPNYIYDSNLNAAIEKDIDEFIYFLTVPQARFNTGAEAISSTKPRFDKSTSSHLPKNTALIKYFMDVDRLFIILNTAEGQDVVEVKIKPSELTEKIYNFRNALKSNKVGTEAPASDLHGILFKPIEELIAGKKIRQIFLSLDGNLRYVPFQALFNGKQYLIEQYDFSIYEDFGFKYSSYDSQKKWRIAGFGTTKQFNNLPPLPAVGEELRGIIKNPDGGIYPGQIYLNENFTLGEVNKSLKDGYPALHIATHFQFSPGTEINSYLLLGNGEKLTLAQLKKINFKNVDLITFSACQTGLGGGKDENGREVAGLSYITLKNGASSVVATLWSVSDKSTALLMKKMYEYRFKKGLSKSESLRMAQIDLLRSREYSNPFFWAPFEIYESGVN